MPLYEYECGRCGRFEKIRSFSDPPLAACPTCQGEIERLASAPAIQFKGAGWYVTDYARKGSGPKEAGAEGKASGSAEVGGSSSGTPASATSSPSTPSAPGAAGSGKSS